MVFVPKLGITLASQSGQTVSSVLLLGTLVGINSETLQMSVLGCNSEGVCVLNGSRRICSSVQSLGIDGHRPRDTFYRALS